MGTTDKGYGTDTEAIRKCAKYIQKTAIWIQNILVS
ncbi:hypothetical protein SAMN05444371_0025 [Epilithonimonas mollis]|uniref:Uncharacterized protein n=1 Tax=Epilithonimonas mollis TaxID=216903 RepID=A0A1M6MXG4_9FLAO|nr:hypothetical protein SAMN05444371_0025 [Epilithonimonas mollis]